MWVKSRTLPGFTIVELLIVVVIIGILAAIVVVAYNGITQTAQINAVTAEANQWKKLFEVYKASTGSYPSPHASPTTGGGPGPLAVNRYCLGTGFPQSAGTSYCFAYNNAQYQVAETTGASIRSQLSTISTPPTNTTKYMYGSVVGPYLRYVSASDVRIGTTYPPGITCPDGMLLEYQNLSRTDCFYRLNYN